MEWKKEAGRKLGAGTMGNMNKSKDQTRSRSVVYNLLQGVVIVEWVTPTPFPQQGHIYPIQTMG